MKMSIKLSCSLCCTPCNEYKQLQNEIGESNEIYEITVKYFDPMLLTEERNTITAKEHKVLCEDCWLHIEDFHGFQEAVIRTRNQLEEADVKQLQLQIKLEHNEQEIASHEEYNKFDNCDGQDFSQCENMYIKKDVEEYDNNNNNEEDVLALREDNDDDDEKLLIPLKKTRKSKQLENGKTEKPDSTTTKIEENNTIDKQKEEIKSKRGRKPKGFVKDKVKLEKVKDKATKKKLKTAKEIKAKRKNSYNREKGKEIDVFISKWKPQLECDLCSETVATFDKLRSHFRQMHQVRCYVKCCQRKFYRRCVLAEHVMLHINPDAHKCDICGKSSSTKNNLKLHKKIMHEDTQNYECEECHRVFNQKQTLDRHLLQHVTDSKDFICQECGKGFVRDFLLNTHIKTVHNNDRVCDQCGKTVHGLQALKKHLMDHAGVEKRKFPCDECGLELNSNQAVKRHKASFHHDGTIIFVCGICDKVVSSANALQMHKKQVHLDERKHKCTYCDKAFKRAKVLREHIATHTGQDLYQCPHCPRTFKVSSNMHHHRKRIHPLEWTEGRKHLLPLPIININEVKKKIVL